MILEDHSPLSRVEKWFNLHKHPFAKDITSQRSSDLFARIDELDKNQLVSLQGKRAF